MQLLSKMPQAKWHKSVSPRAEGAKATMLYLPEWRKSVPLELRAEFAFGEEKRRVSRRISRVTFVALAFGEEMRSFSSLRRRRVTRKAQDTCAFLRLRRKQVLL